MGDIFNIDWMDLETVKAVAEKLANKAPRMCVFKHPRRVNYNITFADNRGDLLNQGYKVVYITTNGRN